MSPDLVQTPEESGSPQQRTGIHCAIEQFSEEGVSTRQNDELGMGTRCILTGD